MNEVATQVRDISKLDRQALLSTFAQARQVLMKFEACQDEKDVVQERKDFYDDGKGSRIPSAGEVSARSKRDLDEMRKQNPLEYYGGIACIAAGTLAFLGLLQVSVILGLLCFIPGVAGGAVLFKRSLKKREKVVGDNLVVLNARLDEALTLCEQSTALQMIPPAYRYSYAMEQMGHLVQNYRANTWMECADRYEENMHRMRMEAHAEEAAELAALSAFYSHQAAGNARAAAIFSGLNFFFG